MLADNLGFGDLSVYNGGIRGGMQTPNIDRLAGEGLRFTQFLVEPGCTPSRAGLMTGQYSIRSGMSLIIAAGGQGAAALGDRPALLGAFQRHLVVSDGGTVAADRLTHRVPVFEEGQT